MKNTTWIDTSKLISLFKPTGTSSLDSRQEGYMNAIHESNRYLSELLNTVLDQAKIDAGKLNLSHEPFDLAKVAEEIKLIFGHAAVKKNIRLTTVETEALHEYHLIGDGFRVKQILNNLVGNAIKFTEHGAVTLFIEGKKHGDCFNVEMIVSDTGPGIRPDKLKTIFEPFVQEKAAIAKSHGGTGLGLSITRSLVEAMNGSIRAANNPGDGVSFTVFLTLPCIPAAPASRKDVHAAPRYYARARVMVVEDDRWNAILLQELLKPRVSVVDVFEDANAALGFLTDASHTADLIFTDINMPGLRGDLFMERVKLLRRNIPVVAVTAHMHPDRLTELKRNGFDQVCKKPFEVTDIENILSRYLGAKAAHDGAHMEELKTAVMGDLSFSFDFSRIRKFSGEDESLFARLIEEMVDNHERQILQFKTFLRAKDHKSLADLAHQMKTTYDTLKLEYVSESLESIEVHAKFGNVGRIMETAHDLFPELEQILTGLQHVRRRCRIA